ncbi:NAD(P)-binding domain-containing protein [Nonomuraea jiangxiensis]|uniref:Thioredoxin reductase n=1 Tax=Nonomuraea jiangxiensis TaxID=633440 RepID=A0A1G9B4A9_9ACTN|nr:NAD(P)-binding domain-containing protein [Nonomuraea jiangxiensis]SDK34361.1 Thioredoxin reductase [Nonomuraea jiangxiensis]
MTHDHRFVVIGAGPGGLQLSYFLQRAGADYVTLEREAAPGGFFRHYPRHRRLISLNKVHTGEKDREIQLRWDWNSLLNDGPELAFPSYSQEYFPHADDLVRYLADFQRVHGLRVRYSTPVLRVERYGESRFAVHTGDAVYHADCVIVATGWGGAYVPDIPGIELATGYEDAPVSGEGYAGQRVLILGKGNSAFETAQALLPYASVIHLASPNPLRLTWDSKHPGHVRGMYGALLDSYWFKTLHAVLECTVDRIWRADGAYRAEITYTLADGERAVLDYDAVLRCTGFTMDTGLFDESCRPELAPNGRIPAIRPDFQSANIDGLYFAGTLMQARDFKRASSAFIDGFRYNLRTLAALLCERYDGVPLPSRELPADAGLLTEHVLGRVNHSSALWTQFEYLSDAYVIGPAVRHYEDLPEDYAVSRFAGEDLLLTVTLRWGRRDHPDVFAIRRHPTPERADECAFLHPVVRVWRRGEQVAERHLLEDLQARWQDPERHAAPLRSFLSAHLPDR